MKKKVINIILVGLVLLVWGGVVQRGLQRPEKSNGRTLPVERSKPDPIASTRGYVPVKLERDPFLDEDVIRASRVPDRKVIAPVRKRVDPPPMVRTASAWPSVKYLGLVSNANDASKRVGFFNINGTQRMLGIGTAQEGLQVVSMQIDLATVMFNGEQKSIEREKNGSESGAHLEHGQVHRNKHNTHQDGHK